MTILIEKKNDFLYSTNFICLKKKNQSVTVTVFKVRNSVKSCHWYCPPPGVTSYSCDTGGILGSITMLRESHYIAQMSRAFVILTIVHLIKNSSPVMAADWLKLCLTL